MINLWGLWPLTESMIQDDDVHQNFRKNISKKDFVSQLFTEKNLRWFILSYLFYEQFNLLLNKWLSKAIELLYSKKEERSSLS